MQMNKTPLTNSKPTNTALSESVVQVEGKEAG